MRKDAIQLEVGAQDGPKLVLCVHCSKKPFRIGIKIVHKVHFPHPF
jgi:hypothetical protein